MPTPIPEHRETIEQRLTLERRSGTDRRSGEVSPGFAPGVSLPGAEPARGISPPFERRGGDRRSGAERRAQIERRLSLQSAEDQIHGALKLLTLVAEGSALGERHRRSLEAAMLRLQFALERMEGGRA